MAKRRSVGRRDLPLSPRARAEFVGHLAAIDEARRRHPEREPCVAVVDTAPGGRAGGPRRLPIRRMARAPSAAEEAARTRFSEWYRRHDNLIWVMARDHGGHDLDLTYEIFEQAGVRLWGHFRAAGAGVIVNTSFVRKVVRSAASDVKRRLRPVAALATAESRERRVAQKSREAWAVALIAACEAATDHLAPEEAEALRLCAFGRASQAEAAEAMGMSQPSVSRLLRRALRRVRELVPPELADRAMWGWNPPRGLENEWGSLRETRHPDADGQVIGGRLGALGVYGRSAPSAAAVDVHRRRFERLFNRGE